MPRKSSSSSQQLSAEERFPAVARFVSGWGWIEIGQQQGFGFVVRALDEGGMICEIKGVTRLAAALAALETRLARRLKRDGVEL